MDKSKYTPNFRIHQSPGAGPANHAERYPGRLLESAAARWGFSRWGFCDLIEHRSFWGSGRPLRALEASKHMGGFAPHSLDAFKAPRGRPAPKNNRFSIKSLNPHRLNPHRAAADGNVEARFERGPFTNAESRPGKTWAFVTVDDHPGLDHGSASIRLDACFISWGLCAPGRLSPHRSLRTRTLERA